MGMLRALNYWNKLSDHYIEGTKILKETDFETMCTICQDEREQGKFSYTILELKEPMIPNQENSRQLEKLVRQSDIMGLRNNKINIILMNTEGDAAKLVTARFEKLGYQMEIRMPQSR